MRIKTFSDGLLDSNQYLVWNESSMNGAVIDCGNYVNAVESFVRENGINVEYIILTHGHYDHAAFTREHQAAFPEAKLLCHGDEIKVLRDPTANLSVYFGDSEQYPEPDIALKSGDNAVIHGDIPENDIIFKVIDAPGHTVGSFLLLCEKEKIMFTGDVIFKRGRGRTDFKYGDELTMQKTLAMISKMDKAISFYSGHGAPSRLQDEAFF